MKKGYEEDFEEFYLLNSTILLSEMPHHITHSEVSKGLASSVNNFLFIPITIVYPKHSYLKAFFYTYSTANPHVLSPSNDY